MKVNIILEGQEEIESFIAIYSLGLISALEEKVIELERAMQYVFNPYILGRLHKAKINKLLIEIVHLGTELEDVRSLIPDKFDENILDLKSRVVKFMDNNRISVWSANKIFKDIDLD